LPEPGPPSAIAKSSPPLTTPISPGQQGNDGSESPRGGSETTTGTSQSQHTDDHTDDCHHIYHDGPDTPRSHAANRGAGRLGVLRYYQHEMHKSPEHDGCDQGAENNR
jgi:hypothetical protein